MNRRLALACSVSLIAPLRAQERMPRVGYMSWQDQGELYEQTLKGFTEGLRGEGFVPGRHVELLLRSASNGAERFKPIARELAASKVDVFFAPATPMASAAWFASRTTPIVVATILDPVELEFVKSLARPGTRVTGVTTLNDELTVKRMQLLMDMVPGCKRVGTVIDEGMRVACKQEIDHAERAAKKLGLSLVLVNVTRPELLEAGYRQLVDAKVQAVITTLLSTRNGLEKEHAEAALKYRLPIMFELEVGAQLGGLMSYGPDFVDIYRRAGGYTGRILKGSKPAEMAMEQPREFRLVVNLNTAKALGLQVPNTVLLRADDVIR